MSASACTRYTPGLFYFGLLMTRGIERIYLRHNMLVLNLILTSIGLILVLTFLNLINLFPIFHENLPVTLIFAVHGQTDKQTNKRESEHNLRQPVALAKILFSLSSPLFIALLSTVAYSSFIGERETKIGAYVSLVRASCHWRV